MAKKKKQGGKRLNAGRKSVFVLLKNIKTFKNEKF